MGAPQEVIDQASAQETQEIEVYPENKTAIVWALVVIEQNFLIWQNGICLGPNAADIGADKALRQFDATADDYQRMLIAVGGFIKTVNARDTAST